MPVQVVPPPGDFPWCRATHSAAETMNLGRRAAGFLQGGEALLLYGVLGAGKTCFVQGLCQGLGVTGAVTSPSFTLVNSYFGRLVVHHLDFFRIGRAADLADIGVEALLEELEDGRAVLVVEWPEPLLPLVPVRLEWLVRLGPRGNDRLWHLRGVPELPPRWHEFIAAEP